VDFPHERTIGFQLKTSISPTRSQAILCERLEVFSNLYSKRLSFFVGDQNIFQNSVSLQLSQSNQFPLKQKLYPKVLHGMNFPLLFPNPTRGESHCGLAIYIEMYLKAKEELWKLKYFTIQKYYLQKTL
jgi:hypothetical protein